MNTSNQLDYNQLRKEFAAKQRRINRESVFSGTASATNYELRVKAANKGTWTGTYSNKNQ